MNGKKWSAEDIEFLESRWGSSSIKKIAKELGRTFNAVKLKAKRLGLDDPTLHYDGITINQLAMALNVHYGILSRWEEAHNLPVRKKVLAQSQKVKVITYQSFWGWAEKNRHLIDFSKVEKNILGAEPSWVAEKRKADFTNSQVVKKSPWTAAEDTRLKDMLKAYSYTYPEIAKALKRSEGAVKRRIRDLGLKNRPIALNNHIKYTEKRYRHNG